MAAGGEAGLWAAEGDGCWAASWLQKRPAMPGQVVLEDWLRWWHTIFTSWVCHRKSWTHFMMFQVVLGSWVFTTEISYSWAMTLKPRLSKQLSDFNHLMLGETPLLAAEPLQKVQFVEWFESFEIDIKLAFKKIKPRPSIQCSLDAGVNWAFLVCLFLSKSLSAQTTYERALPCVPSLSHTGTPAG